MIVWNRGLASPEQSPGETNPLFQTVINVYSGNIIKIHYTLRTLYNHKTPQQPIFAETYFLKQPHTSRLNTPY